MTASTQVGLLCSGSSRMLNAMSATIRATEMKNHTGFATASGTTPRGIASTANAGRYLNW